MFVSGGRRVSSSAKGGSVVCGNDASCKSSRFAEIALMAVILNCGGSTAQRNGIAVVLANEPGQNSLYASKEMATVPVRLDAIKASQRRYPASSVAMTNL